MCARVTQRLSSAELARLFEAENLAELAGDRCNVAQRGPIAVVVRREERRAVVAYRWGLIPHWAKDPKTGGRNINARAETVARSPAYRDAFARTRCLVPVSGFYEWQRQPEAHDRRSTSGPATVRRSPWPGCGPRGGR